MKEKKPPLKKIVAGELTRSFHEILVADKRAYEPFVKVFQAVGENVSKLDLGSLVGVFEVDEKSEDAAYIVNFLASVAKKEYFNNPRRGPIESFEAALHKVNVALAELVKHGNVSWLGKLHGALAVIEKNNLHFSVTGEGAFLLLRQEQFSEISAGLASSEAENHPLKTFVEVSSGRLIEDDTLLLVTPELNALFPLDYLTKQASRMKKDGFRQFLRTALVNEIDMAAVMVIEFGAPSIVSSPETIPHKTSSKKETPTELVINAFSGNTYNKKPSSKKDSSHTEEITEISESEPKEEFIDEKTGHIYVQGMDVNDAPTAGFAFLETLSDISSYAGDFFSRTFRRQSKKFARFSTFILWEAKRKSGEIKRKTNKRIAHLAEQVKEKQAEKKRLREELAAQDITVTFSPDQNTSEPIAEEAPRKIVDTYTPDFLPEEEKIVPEKTLEESEPVTDFKSSSLLRLRNLYQENPQASILKKEMPKASPQTKILMSLPTFPQVRISVAPLLKKIKTSTETLPSLIPPLLTKKTTLFLTLGVIVISSIVLFFFLFKDSHTEEVATPPTPTPVTTEDSTKKTTPSNELTSEKTFTLGKQLVALTFLDNAAYGATPKGILDIETNQEFIAPDIKGEIRYITPMDDLSLLFVLTSQNELLAWSPSTKTFTKNDLILPENTRVTGLGSYLTYLYVLDRGNNQLYRYPRTENGFIASTNWMKESFELTDTAFLAINETVALAPSREHLLSFIQGKTNGNFEFQDPKAPIAIQALTTDNDFPFIYALEKSNALSIWNTERKLLHTYTLKEAPKDILYLAVDPEKKILLVGNKDGGIVRYINVTSE